MRRIVVLMLIPTVFSSSTPLFVVCVSKQCVCNEMTMQLVINYQSVYRFDVPFLYVDKYISYFVYVCGIFFRATVVRVVIWGIVIAVLQIANATNRSKFYLLISFCAFFFVFSSNLFWLNKKKKQVRTFWHDRFGEMKENSQSAQCCFCSEDKNKRAFFDIFTLFHRTLSILRPFEMVFAAIKAVSQTVFYNEKWKTWVKFHEPIKFVCPKKQAQTPSKQKKITRRVIPFPNAN